MRRLFLQLIVVHLAFAFVVGAAAQAASSAPTRPPRVLKFQGIPLAQGQLIRQKFPFVFEREVSLSEVDDVTRFLMTTGLFSNIEVLERNTDSGQGRELVLVGSVLRRVREIEITGNQVLNVSDITRVLNVKSGQPFERKNLLAAAGDLREEYERLGYHSARVEIEFALPSDNEVNVRVTISEGLPVRVTEVAVDSPNEKLNASLASLARSLKNHKLTEDELIDFQKNVADYLHDHRYLTARLSSPSVTTNAERTQAKLVYTIENPYRYEFRFSGNVYFSDGAIAAKLEDEKLSGATASPAPDMAELIRRLYQNVGYANVDVEVKEERGNADDPYRNLINFKIAERPRVRIKKIEITGSISRAPPYYTAFIQSSSSDLIGAGFYNRRDIDDGSKKLITELQNQGYLRARIQTQRAEYSKDRSTVTIALNVDEGPLTQVSHIRFEGTAAFSTSHLQSLIKIKPGAALSLKDLEDSLRALRDFYHENGYLEMRILNEGERNKIVTYNDTNTQASVDIQVLEGPRVTVHEIVLKGNTFTKDSVILRELTFKTGTVLTPTGINESLSRIQSLGYFSHVSIRTLEENSNIADRTVQIEVEEANPGLFTIGAGATNERQLTLRGYAGVSYRNIAGTGRGVVLRVDPKYSTDPDISYLENRETFSYIEPYIFGDRNVGRINVIRDQSYYGRNQTPGSPNDVEILETNSIGFIVERDLAKHIKLTYTAYNFANRKSFDRKTYQILQTLNVGKMGPLVEFDFRDNPFYPTKGSYSFVSGEYADPLFGSSDDSVQSINFWKLTSSYTFYQRLFPSNPDWVWATSLRGGLLQNVSGKPQSGVPSEEAFFLGGRSTIRGYDTGSDERLPSNYDLNVQDILQFYMRTHSEYVLAKTELRFPIYKNFALGPLGGVVFYDGGAVYLHEPGLSIENPFRDSVGLGVRVSTPVGPLNLEYGWKLDRRQSKLDGPNGRGIEESSGAFHFSIGGF